MTAMARVESMASTIEARRLALGLTIQDLVDQTGLTRPGLAPLLRGDRRNYQERLTLPICRVLRWTPDSIDRLLAGQEPIETSPITRPDDELVELRAQVADLTRTVRELGASVATLAAEVARLRGQPNPPAHGTL
jgi:transcriptional regulator with XRE-family HTH domain